MPFKRIATLDIKQVYATDENGKFQWRSFVKQANDNPSQDRTDFLPKDAYKYDTNHFLFLTARAISGGEKWGHNGNYDYFPWEEIKKALPTYPGCGFYIEHKEDSEEDAKGIVLDAFANDEEEYAVCLCAIDKDEYPEFCQQILDGTYNQVSMSCLANECECSECGNVAHSFDELCQHMNPNMPVTYMKGKTNDKGEDIYEINRDLCFSGLSAVAVPADKDAFVFDIKASKKKENKLQAELVKYQNIKQAAKMKEFRTACEEEFKALDTVALLNKLQTCANAITNQVMDNSTGGRDIINAPLQGILKELMELQIGLTVLDLNKLNQPKEEVVEEKADNGTLLTVDELKEPEVNLDKEIDSMLKQAEGNFRVYIYKVPETTKYEYVKKFNSIDDAKTFLLNFNKEGYSFAVSDGKSTLGGGKLPINNEQLDILLNDSVNLDKEIDSYLDGDNWSYTPFSSTASKGRNIKYFDNTMDMLKWIKQNKDSIQNVTIEMNCFGDSCAKVAYETSKEIDSSLDKIIEKTYK